MFERPPLVRDADAGSYLESFLVWAVAAILGIRGYLALTGYPQLGGGGLHIAHMLWGGLLMLAALVFALAFLGKWAKRWAAVLGGLGFGTFIDELGKFVTRDNDYFFRPTIGILYVLLVLLFLLFRWIGRRRPLSPEEQLVNAADLVREVVLDGASREEVARALALLEGVERAGLGGPVPAAIRAAVEGAARAPDRGPSLAGRAGAWGRRAHDRLLAWPPFHRALLALFVLEAAAGLAAVLLAGAAAAAVALTPATGADLAAGAGLERGWLALGSLASSATETIFVVVGAVRLLRARLAALRWFKRSLLVSIFFSQVFLFLQAQFAALWGLAFDLLLLQGVNYLLHEEAARRRAAALGVARPQRGMASPAAGGLPA